MRVPPLSEWLIEFEPSKITIAVGKNIPTLPSFLERDWQGCHGSYVRKRASKRVQKRRAALIDAARRTGLVAADGSPGDGGGARHPRATNPLMQIGALSSKFSSKYL